MSTIVGRSNDMTANSEAGEPPVTYIKARSGWEVIDFQEIKRYQDLFFFLVWRDIKVLYAQTILGFSWAILQPLMELLIFAVVFGGIAGVSTEGIPYVLFTSVGIVPWTYMSQAMSQASQSLITGQHMLDKIYFPRLLFPMTPVLAKLLDFGISMLIIVGVMIYYQIVPSWNLLLLPFFVFLMMCIAGGAGMLLSAMAIRYRDVKHAMPFAIRMLMFSAPIVYSASSVPATYRQLYSLNPVVAVIEGFRACLLGTPMPWQYVWPGTITASILLIIGALYFKRMERGFVDVL
jgi:lipopolysaccharide transport system permease protein